MLGDCAWSSRLIAKTGKAAEAQDLEEALDKARVREYCPTKKFTATEGALEFSSYFSRRRFGKCWCVDKFLQSLENSILAIGHQLLFQS
jgi:hypothetical protein